MLKKIKPIFIRERNLPRPSTLIAKKIFGKKPLTIVEIGSFEGLNALTILKTLNVKKLYLIDPWEEYMEYDEKEKNQRTLNKAFIKCKKRLADYKDKVSFIKKYSNEAIKDIPSQIDFIYIDGNHAYDYVKKDMKLFFPKIKKGGLFAGHDIASCEGVTRAFIEFVYKNKLKPNILNCDWWIIK